MADLVLVQTRVPRDVYRELAQLAADEGASIAFVVRRLLVVETRKRMQTPAVASKEGASGEQVQG